MMLVRFMQTSAIITTTEGNTQRPMLVITKGVAITGASPGGDANNAAAVVVSRRRSSTHSVQLSCSCRTGSSGSD